MITRNPYVIGVPLTDGTAFYGRQEFFRFIKDVLEAEKQNVIVLYGQRRIGKTSVLHRTAAWLERQGGFSPVYYDLQGKERMALGDVLANLAQTLARRLKLDSPAPDRFDPHGRYFADEFLPDVFEHLGNERLVLLMDEFDVLGDELASTGSASETLFPYLQALIVNRPQMGFVFVVGRRIEELASHFQAIFKQAVYRRVGHLSPEDSKALILEPSRDIVTFDDDAVSAIQQLAAGHPYFTQLICFEAFNAVKNNGHGTVDAEVVHNVVTRAIESGHGALNWFWEGLPRAERFILSAVAHVSDDSGVGAKEDVRKLLEQHRILLSGLELKDAPDRLVEWEMLRRSGPESYQFVVELVRRWVIQEHPLANARRDIDYVNKRAVRLFENAREAHSAGDLEYARDEYQRALNANPNHSGAQLGLALTQFELGDIEAAVIEFERAYLIDEMSARDGLVRTRLARARIAEDQQRVEAAVPEYEHVLRLVPTEDTAHRRLSAIWQTRGENALAVSNLGGARDAFREVLKHDAQRDAANRLQTAIEAHADEAVSLGNVKEGADSHALLLELLPDRDDVKARSAAFLSRCADTVCAQGALDAALELYERVEAIFPGDAVVTERIRVVRQMTEDRLAVSRIYEQTIAAHSAGRLDEAREGWKKLIQLDVLSYKGHNIGALLAETVVPQPSPRGAAPPTPTRPEPAVARPEVEAEFEALAEVPDLDAEDDSEEAVAAPVTKKAKGGRTRQKAGGSKARPKPDPEPEPVHAVREDETLSEASAEDAPLLFHTPARSPERRLGIVLFVVGFVVLVAWAVYSLVPARLERVSLFYYGPSLKIGGTVELFPSLQWSSGRRPSNADPGQYAYSWSSSDEKVATVSSGTVKAIGPGTARITATYRDKSDWTSVSVADWDVPAMKAQVDSIKLFPFSGTSNPPDFKDRKYVPADTAVDSSTTKTLWVEFTFDINESDKDRALTASFRQVLTNLSTGAELSDVPFSMTAQRDWPGIVQTVPLTFPSTPISAGSYRIDLKHMDRVIGSRTFSIK